MKRLTALLALGLAPVAVSAQQTTIDYYTFTADGGHADELDILIAAFEAENPNIDVRPTIIPFASYFTKLQTDIAAGQAPDVFDLNYENFVTYASRDLLEPLDPHLNLELKESFYPAALNAFQHDGHQYGLPITFSTVVLYYNKDLFDKAGVGYPTDDWTWDDVLSAARKINDPANLVWGIHQPAQFWEFYKVAAQAGGGIEVGPEVRIDTPENREALRYLVAKPLEHKVMPTDAEMSGVPNEAMFLNGQLGMMISGIWLFDQMAAAPFEWDIAVEPAGAKRATHFFANAAAVSRDADSAEAAARWVTFLATSPLAAKTRIESAWELPALSLSQEGVIGAYLKKSPPRNRAAVFKSLEYAVTPPVVANQTELQDIINREIEAARLGSKSVEQALADAQKAVEVLVKE